MVIGNGYLTCVSDVLPSSELLALCDRDGALNTSTLSRKEFPAATVLTIDTLRWYWFLFADRNYQSIVAVAIRHTLLKEHRKELLEKLLKVD
ncbi:hypothetical protein KIN20_026263 [Parelaphostrongylus tenuis]|uniref:Uncharacterized protein n=1 Tax=Parelaphostrongylus tenuis TaxID=148309 RepID=A0AAD5N0G0_PARTN|nr:hypothetical protein KIN20_026263 [Parelaphostrongylus tenuis]